MHCMYIVVFTFLHFHIFPHCMERQHGLAMKKVSLCKTRAIRALWQNGRKSVQNPYFLYHMRDHLA